jgi:hypothetical protein
MAKAYVFKRRRTWFYEVRDSEGRVLFADNTNDWRKIFDAAFRDATGLKIIERVGHRVEKSWSQLVDEAVI